MRYKNTHAGKPSGKRSGARWRRKRFFIAFYASALMVFLVLSVLLCLCLASPCFAKQKEEDARSILAQDDGQRTPTPYDHGRDGFGLEDEQEGEQEKLPEEAVEEEVVEEEVVEEEGSKIPGPTSWWEWLTGTVVAGVIAAGISLVNMIFPSTPPPPPVAEPAWPEPPEPGIAGGTIDQRQPFEGLPPPEQVNLVEVAVTNMLNNIKAAPNWAKSSVDEAEKSLDKISRQSRERRPRSLGLLEIPKWSVGIIWFLRQELVYGNRNPIMPKGKRRGRTPGGFGGRGGGRRRPRPHCGPRG